MKKLVLTAAFVMASFGAFASNNDVKLKNTIVPVKNNVEIVNNSNVDETKTAHFCKVTVDLGVISFYYLWEY